jgi:hypothetical protein
MVSAYLYLSMIPEALIASMLPPLEFGTYLAVGTKKRTRGQAMFFSLGDLGKTPFNLRDIENKCVPHPNGEPKRSLYLSVYRVLERIPLSSIQNLFMATPDGRVLELAPSGKEPEHVQPYNLYQEICPVHPRIVSTLDPKRFTRYITDPGNPIHVPKICFVDLRLGELASDPENGGANDLPYRAINHLRDCLVELRDNPGKGTKTVDRIHPQAFPYQTVASGVYLGSGEDLLFYPFPSVEQLQSTYYEWWRSASIMSDLTTVP